MIPVRYEPDPGVWSALGNCCFCREPTFYRTALWSRKRDEQVPCCPDCRQFYHPFEVPSTAAWRDLVTAWRWARGIIIVSDLGSPTYIRVRAGIVKRLHAKATKLFDPRASDPRSALVKPPP